MVDNDNIHEAIIREDELNETHTRYDNIVAAASDENRFIQWTVYATIALSVTAFVLVVLVAILRKEDVRRRSYNLFLVFLIIPDLTFSFFCGINCALNAANGDYISAPWCRWQVVYSVWGIGSNAWLNAAIVRHLHQMLKCCACRRRYFAPSRRRVVIESLVVYAWMAFVSSWVFIPFLPHRLALSAGLACLPHEYDRASTIFLWVVFMPCFALIPTAYAAYVAFDIYRRKLLPPNGKARDLALYFFRLVAVYLIMWVPSIFLMFIAGGYTSSWVAFIGGCWSHFQGAVSGICSVMKRDINESFVELVCCTSTSSTSSNHFLTGRVHRPARSGSFSTTAPGRTHAHSAHSAAHRSGSFASITGISESPASPPPPSGRANAQRRSSLITLSFQYIPSRMRSFLAPDSQASPPTNNTNTIELTAAAAAAAAGEASETDHDSSLKKKTVAPSVVETAASTVPEKSEDGDKSNKDVEEGNRRAPLTHDASARTEAMEEDSTLDIKPSVT